MAEGSILDDIKKLLGLDSTYTAFDLDVKLHINSVFAVLNGVGIGPDSGFMILDNSATWDAFIGDDDPQLNVVKSYIFLRVRMLFDPPTTSMAIDAMAKMAQEFEWRLNIKREGESWTDPNPPTPSPPEEAISWWGTF